MNPIVRNILAVIAAIIVGSIVNGLLISIGSAVIAPPAGVDPSNLESIKASIHLYEPKHFAVPFVAHAAGTLVGGLLVSMIAASRRFTLSIIVGAFFMLGGIAACFLIPAPAWFMALDLLVAYIPMALLGWKLGGKQ